jgi:DeoR/GlpR family transcriptional regulator of sugar metabolism
MNKILTRHGEKNELARIFSVSLPTIRAALNGVSSNELAIRIRTMAKERGAIEVGKIL